MNKARIMKRFDITMVSASLIIAWAGSNVVFADSNSPKDVTRYMSAVERSLYESGRIREESVVMKNYLNFFAASVNEVDEPATTLVRRKLPSGNVEPLSELKRKTGPHYKPVVQGGGDKKIRDNWMSMSSNNNRHNKLGTPDTRNKAGKRDNSSKPSSPTQTGVPSDKTIMKSATPGIPPSNKDTHKVTGPKQNETFPVVQRREQDTTVVSQAANSTRKGVKGVGLGLGAVKKNAKKKQKTNRKKMKHKVTPKIAKDNKKAQTGTVKKGRKKRKTKKQKGIKKKEKGISKKKGQAKGHKRKGNKKHKKQKQKNEHHSHHPKPKPTPPPTQRPIRHPPTKRPAHPRTVMPTNPPTKKPAAHTPAPTPPTKNPTKKPPVSKSPVAQPTPNTSPTSTGVGSSFDISLCDSYRLQWLVDLSQTCNQSNLSNLNGCVCTTAESLLANGSISCASSKCPINCDVCAVCLKLIGCT